MINLDFNDPPVRPAVEGTYELPGGGRGMFFTIGRDYVEEKLKELLRHRSVLASDIEAFGLGNLRFRIKVVTFADDKDAVILDPRDEYQYNLIKWVHSELQGIIYHNVGYDVPSLYQRGLFEKEDISKVMDTIVFSRQSTPGELQRHKLEVLSQKHFGFKAEAKKKSDSYYTDDIHMISYIHGSALDTLCTYKLLPILIKEVQQRLEIPPLVKGLELNKEEKDYILWREQHVTQVLLPHMAQGLKVDLDEVDKYDQKVAPQRNRLEIILKQNGMSLQPRTGSYTNGNELIRILTQLDAIPPQYPRTATKKLSTTEENLELLQHPVAQAFSQLKKILKTKSYLDKIADEAYRTERVFPSTNILGARTGRVSMSDPPLQQFIPPARPVIIAEDYDTQGLASIDWSQVEPALLIYCASDEVAISRYESGESDIYNIVGSIAGIERKKAKTTLLAQMYGQGIAALSLRLDVSESTSREYRDRIFAGLPESAKFIQNFKQIGLSGHVHTLSGRVLDVDSFQGKLKAFTAINRFVQGSAYDLLAEALIRIDNAGLSKGIYFTYHDELVVNAEMSEDIAAIMRKPPDRMVQLLDRDMEFGADPVMLGRHWSKPE